MNSEIKKIAILGSTGSVGIQSVEVARNLSCEVDLLMASSSVETIEVQARDLKPKVCVMTNEAAADLLKTRLADTDIKVYSGEKSAISAIEESSAKVAVNAVSGFAGLAPAIACAKSGKRIAMSNKEAIVIAHKFLLDEINKSNAELIPVDSEHSAIFQCLDKIGDNKISRIILTSSGGPFRGRKRDELKDLTAKDALSHPTWKMGAKITVDSASLMNKGFEVIEAVRLFGVTPDQVKVVVHPQSIMHSAVEYIDNSVIAQMSVPDMRYCIQYGICGGARESAVIEALDLAKISNLSFYNPDTETFPLLSYAIKCKRDGGAMPAVLNASNEIAVSAFLEDKLSFMGISDSVIETVKALSSYKFCKKLDDILAADKAAREYATRIIYK